MGNRMRRRCIARIGLVLSIVISEACASATPELEYELSPRSEYAILGETFYVDYFVKNNTEYPIILCECHIDGEIIFGKLNGNEADLKIDRFKTTEQPKESDYFTVPPFGTAKVGFGGFGEEYFSSKGDWVLKIRNTYTGEKNTSGVSSWQGIVESDYHRVSVK